MIEDNPDLPFCGHVPVNCALCGADDARVLWTVRGKYRNLFSSDRDEDVVKCRNCGFVYLNPIPDPQVLLHAWADQPVVEEEVAPIAPLLQTAAQGDVTNIRRFKRSGEFLEIGSGYGALLNAAQQAGFQVHGWEVNLSKCEYTKRKYGVEDVFSTDLAEVGFADQMFDVVAMLDVIEHVKDVRALLAEIRRILKDDGILYLNTPNFAGIRRRFNGRRWPYLTSLSHVYFFTAASLDRLLRTEGLHLGKRLIRPAASPIRHLAKLVLSKMGIYEDLCVVAKKV